MPIIFQGRCLDVDGRNDQQDFVDMCAAMKVLFFSDEEMRSVFRLLASVLHLGNINYSATTVNNLDATEIKDATHAIRAAKLLQVCASIKNEKGTCYLLPGRDYFRLTKGIWSMH